MHFPTDNCEKKGFAFGSHKFVGKSALSGLSWEWSSWGWGGGGGMVWIHQGPYPVQVE